MNRRTFLRTVGAGTVLAGSAGLLTPRGVLADTRPRAFVLRDANGQVYRKAGSHEDITDYDEAELRRIRTGDVDAHECGHTAETYEQPGKPPKVELVLLAEQVADRGTDERYGGDQESGQRAGQPLFGVTEQEPRNRNFDAEMKAHLQNIIRDEDLARLSPLVHGHINMLGRYSFAMPETVARGELRPLRSPDAPDA